MKSTIQSIKYKMWENKHYKRIYNHLELIAHKLHKKSYEYALHNDYREGLIETSKQLIDVCAKNKPLFFNFKNSYRQLGYELETLKILKWKKYDRKSFRGTFEFGASQIIESFLNEKEGLK